MHGCLLITDLFWYNLNYFTSKKYYELKKNDSYFRKYFHWIAKKDSHHKLPADEFQNLFHHTLNCKIEIEGNHHNVNIHDYHVFQYVKADTH